jgi:ubiquinone biosynthesis protein COQ4
MGMKTFFSRLRGHWAGVRLLLDPSKLDQVFEIDAAIPDQEAIMARVAEAMRAHPDGARALAERPRLALDLAALRALPEGTFGRAVADFFDEKKLDPRSIPTLEATDEVQWTKAHLYETHDVWHVATGFPTDVAGELGLQAFYAAQIPGRLPQLLLAGGLLQAALFEQDDFRPRLAAIARGWEMGQRARPLFGVPWNRLFEAPLPTVRTTLALPL